MLKSICTLKHTFIEPRACMNESAEWKANNSSTTGLALKKFKRDGVYIDRTGNLRNFNHKKLSRKKNGSMRGRGWKFGSGFVDGIFPVLSPTAEKILEYLQREVDIDNIWGSLDMLPPSMDAWDDILSVSVQLRMRKQWDSIISICKWILLRSSFKPDIICYNLLIDAFGQKFLFKEAESMYLELLEAKCIPNEDTYALLIKAYCMSGMLENAEAVFAEMRNYGFPSSAVVYNAYINGLMKGGNPDKAEEIFQRMMRDGCKLSTETYTMLINLYGKAGKSFMALKLFDDMMSHKCKPNICTYTALVNAFAREGLCEKAEEIFEQMQEAGLEPDVYAYNALMESYSRAGFPYGAAEIFSLMQHMGCEPDRASYNILVDAYGKAGFQDDAEAVFEDMRRVGITPTMKSHMVLLSAYSKMGNVSKCENIVNQMCKSGLKLDTFVLNSMLNLYGRLGQFGKMEEVLTVMEKGSYVIDISTFNILIHRYGQAGFIERMEQVFELLPSKGLKPDVVTWTSRIGAYSKKKLYLRCLQIFEEMIDAGCYPDGGTAKVLLAACSNEDQTQQVTSVIRTMHKDINTNWVLMVTAQTPTNIAVIKYWGKRDETLILPVNDSISVTLDPNHLCTTTTVAVSPTFNQDRMWLNGKEISLSGGRFQSCLREIRARACDVEDTKKGIKITKEDWSKFHLHIASYNNFPTAAGLASSAAGFACLVYALGKLMNVKEDESQLSAIARQGSGSACRSLFGGFVKWIMGQEKNGSDSLAVQLADENHWDDLVIVIAVVSSRQKETSSTSGMRETVETSLLLQHRAKEVVPKRILQMEEAIRNRDFASFSQLTCADSNQFHAVCLDTQPPIFYMNDTSHRVISIVEKWNRSEEAPQVAYTFDAGPNAVMIARNRKAASLLIQRLLYYFPPSSDNLDSYIIGDKSIAKDAGINGIQDIEALPPPAEIKDNIPSQKYKGDVDYFICTRPGRGPVVLSDESQALLNRENGLPK